MGAEGIGARVRRKEDDRHLRGRGRFVGDIALPGLQEVAFLRSPVAHARLLSVRKPVTGDVVVAGDLMGLRPIVTRSAIPGYKVSAYPAIAGVKVRFVGDIIAAAIAASRAEAEDLCGRIEPDLEELPAIVDVHRGPVGARGR